MAYEIGIKRLKKSDHGPKCDLGVDLKVKVII